MWFRSLGRHTARLPAQPVRLNKVQQTPSYTASLFDLYNTDKVGQKPVMPGDPRTYGAELRMDF